MDSAIAIEIIQIAATGVISTLAVLLGFKKIFKSINDTGTESNVTKLMHEELTRMSVLNTKLTEELGKLQHEIIILNRQLITLSEENQRLHTEVASLTEEVARLKTLLEGK
jgi:predicted nuclease with TOPRIM domain